MSTWALQVEQVSKSYRVGRRGPGNNLREELMRWLNPHAWWKRPTRPQTFWALQDIELCVERGAILGLLGANGAGKSTLLKILARITPPTQGEIRYRGRLASLLEVGTGFHRELTGRENIFLNGAILGMRRHEIARQLDAIVDFAGVASFLDEPVKSYSSGMYVRLAFAVAAHLRSDLLVVDEVLAVGDQRFQKQCLSHMQAAAAGGRTVLFVSHQASAVRQLCTSAALLEAGRLVHHGSVDECLARYLPRPQREHVTLASQVGLPTLCVQLNLVGTRLEVALTTTDAGSVELFPTLLVHDSAGQILAGTSPRFAGNDEVSLTRSAGCHCVLDLAALRSGEYRVSVHVRTPHAQVERHEECLTFTLDNRATPPRLPAATQFGSLLLPAHWSSSATPHLSTETGEVLALER